MAQWTNRHERDPKVLKVSKVCGNSAHQYLTMGLFTHHFELEFFEGVQMYWCQVNVSNFPIAT